MAWEGGAFILRTFAREVYGEDDEDEGKTPLFEKLDKLAANIGKGGTAAALLCFAAMSRRALALIVIF